MLTAQEPVKEGTWGRAIQSIQINIGLLIRLLIAGLFLFLVYQFDWTPLRFLTLQAILYLSQLFGFPVRAVSSDTLELFKAQYQIVVSCTMIDAFCASIPLVWELQSSLFQNLWKLTKFFVCLSALNIFRLELGLILYINHVPWLFAHEVISGITYFLLALWILRQRSWASGPYFTISNQFLNKS